MHAGLIKYEKNVNRLMIKEVERRYKTFLSWNADCLEINGLAGAFYEFHEGNAC